MAYIHLKDVVKQYGTGNTAILANDHINLEIEEGEFVVILGPSGAGKSTLLNILGGMDAVTSGEVLVADKNIASYDEKGLTEYRRDEVGFIFQNYNLIPNLTAIENVEVSEEISDNSLAAKDALQGVGLYHRKDNFPSQLSGGEQQRVSIARAIAKNPKLLLCDEPTGALDYETGKKVLGFLQDLTNEQGTTVVVITHNQAIAPMADRVIKINDGAVSSQELNQQPMPIQDIEW
ncbi:ATP-binding cassette domain-containing protein [Carnobacterium sp. PL12RED10]|uniref:ABC transporter ATP-binding protein n=1 Tax=Carnobacterium sp. PL12RED10 TaxID=2592351 RepID=UPI0011EED814|nr:ABC transporter ATP-binding protein [Carnobacterium sp. PL12RED10]KAF3300023.1 ATP-binding cassette domain-containing protein [Carnobacterium sp. PL12RED10]